MGVATFAANNHIVHRDQDDSSIRNTIRHDSTSIRCPRASAHSMARIGQQAAKPDVVQSSHAAAAALAVDDAHVVLARCRAQPADQRAAKRARASKEHAAREAARGEKVARLRPGSCHLLALRLKSASRLYGSVSELVQLQRADVTRLM